MINRIFFRITFPEKELTFCLITNFYFSLLETEACTPSKLAEGGLPTGPIGPLKRPKPICTNLRSSSSPARKGKPKGSSNRLIDYWRRKSRRKHRRKSSKDKKRQRRQRMHFGRRSKSTSGASKAKSNDRLWTNGRKCPPNCFFRSTSSSPFST